MISEILLQAQALTKNSGERVLVDRVDLTLRRGEVVGLLGLNGAGKTTTLRMLSGVLAPSSGDVMVCGVSMRQDPAVARAQIGYCPDPPALYPEQRVGEFLSYMAALRGMGGTSARRAVERVLDQCQLEPLVRRLIGHLSKGQQQRVAVAQALLHEPTVLIFDEPTHGLDPVQVADMRGLMAAQRQRGAVILSTHVLADVQAICDQVHVLHEGRTLYAGPVGDPQPRRVIEMELRQPPDLAELRMLAALESVTPLSEGRFRCTLADRQLAVDDLVAAAAAGRWGLQQLAPAANSVESLFLSLVQDARAATQ